MTDGTTYTLTRIDEAAWKAVVKWKGNSAAASPFKTTVDAVAWCGEARAMMKE